MERRKDIGGFRGFAFSRTIGMRYWCCPRCNQVNRTAISAQTWLVKCSNEKCSARWIIGEVFYQALLGFKIPPPDTILPREEAPYHRGEPVNQVYCASCSQKMYVDLFKRAWESVEGKEEDYGMDPQYAEYHQRLQEYRWKSEAKRLANELAELKVKLGVEEKNGVVREIGSGKFTKRVEA